MAPAYGQGQNDGRGPPVTTGPPCPPGSDFKVHNGIGRCVGDEPPKSCPPPSKVDPETGLTVSPSIALLNF